MSFIYRLLTKMMELSPEAEYISVMSKTSFLNQRFNAFCISYKYHIRQRSTYL